MGGLLCAGDSGLIRGEKYLKVPGYKSTSASKLQKEALAEKWVGCYALEILV